MMFLPDVTLACARLTARLGPFNLTIVNRGYRLTAPESFIEPVKLADFHLCLKSSNLDDISDLNSTLRFKHSHASRNKTPRLGTSSAIALSKLLQNSSKSFLVLEYGGPLSSLNGGQNVPDFFDGVPQDQQLTIFDIPGEYQDIAFQSQGDPYKIQELGFTWQGKGYAGNSQFNGMLFQSPPSYYLDSFPQGWRSSDMAAAFSELRSKMTVTPTPSTDGKAYLSGIADVMFNGFAATGYTKSDTSDLAPLQDLKGYYNAPYVVTDGNGQRGGPVSAYLKDVVGKDGQSKFSNLKIVSSALVTKIIFNGDVATGVEYTVNNQSQTASLNSQGRIVVGAGALMTPRLLYLSGVGPQGQESQIFEGNSVTFTIDNKAVGSNVYDHVGVQIVVEHDNSVGIETPTIAYGNFAANTQVLRNFVYNRTGPYCQYGPVIAAHIKSDPNTVAHPNVEIFVNPNGVGNGIYNTNTSFQAVLMLLEPNSTARLQLDSSYNVKYPNIYLQSENDINVMVDAMYTTINDIVPNSPGLKVTLGPGGVGDYSYDPKNKADIRSYVKSNNVGGIGVSGLIMNHYTATVPLLDGDESAGGVEPSTLRLRGTRNVHVVDASLLPNSIPAHPVAMVMALGVRAADILQVQMSETYTSGSAASSSASPSNAAAASASSVQSGNNNAAQTVARDQSTTSSAALIFASPLLAIISFFALSSSSSRGINLLVMSSQIHCRNPLDKFIRITSSQHILQGRPFFNVSQYLAFLTIANTPVAGNEQTVVLAPAKPFSEVRQPQAVLTKHHRSITDHHPHTETTSKMATSDKAATPADALVLVEDESDLSAVVTQRLENELELEKLITGPNAVTIEDVVKVANGGRSPNASQSVFGHLIDVGNIGLVEYNGMIQVVGPGRWICPNPRAELVERHSVSESLIRRGPLTIARVARGQIGLATDQGHPIILGEGLHVRNSRFFAFDKVQDLNQPCLKHGSLFVIRVPRGQFGKVTENAIPKLLGEGVHVTNSNLLTFDGFVSANQPVITHATINLIRVPKGTVALVNDNNHYKFLPQGTHFINSVAFKFTGMEDLNQGCIKHGTITRFRVRRGELGLAWEDNEPVFFSEGIYQKDSPNFTFVKCVSASEKEIALGSKKIITVWDGEVGVSFLKGKLQVLYPNRHLIESADHIFHSFLSTQQQCLHLIHQNSKENPDMLSCETKDFVEIGIKADVFYRISDAERVLLVVGKDSVIPLVRETSIATLNAIIRSTSLAEVAQSKEVNAQSERRFKDHAGGASPTAPMFFDKVHDEFIAKLHDSFHDRYGIEICNIRIESFKIMNQELANNISKQALVTTQTETQLANLASQTEIATAQQRRDADVSRIKAEGMATSLKTETDSKNMQIMETAKAEAEATLIAARARAKALEIQAEAEAKAIQMRAEAESQKAAKLSQTSLGSQMTLFEMYTDMVKGSMGNVEKVIYLPSDAQNNPFSFMSLASGAAMNMAGMPGMPQAQTMVKKPRAPGES
ncbi:prohibitin domain-containing protein [Planoprotostelium fungivorum]|uniref:Prohibitin domain-containing protein n=1 Tax=Planoprotostelium fungivorum TaxID=1890364 RepID=A0A2P6NCC2_9EUKA|nr:prohibitin domain-containing protein [Planoprotostelium fungivorum]